MFAWPPVAAARTYLVSFDRGGKRIFQTRSRWRSLDLSAAFRFLPGHYRWQVLPVFGGGAGERLGAAIVDSTFLVSARTAGLLASPR